MAGEIAGFWSYVRADNTAEDGRIVSLSVRVRDEYRIRTGDEIEIFVDQESINWGTEWARRIGDAIAGTTFFIPIITPSYFRSPACRKELLTFTRDAKRLGLEQLVMPIYWVTVSELNHETADGDEAVKIVSQYQREDLRDVRLEDEASSGFRKAVARIADALATRAALISTQPEVPAISRSLHAPKSAHGEPDIDDEPGFIENMAEAEGLFPELTDIQTQIMAEFQVVTENLQTATAEATEAKARQLGMKAVARIIELLAKRLTEPSTNIQRLGQEFISKLTAADPSVHALIDAAQLEASQGSSEASELLRKFTTLADQTAEAVEASAGLISALNANSKVSRSLRAPNQRIRLGLQGIVDAQSLIDEWKAHAAGTRGSQTVRADVNRIADDESRPAPQFEGTPNQQSR